ncbi:hypothetical protein ACEPPN_014282 [Leptodophora sp. 'Broadleaf-Isolate-01']
MSARPQPKRPNCARDKQANRAVKLLQGDPVYLAAPSAARKVLEASVVDGIRADPMYATVYSNSLNAGGVRTRGIGATGGGMGSQGVGGGVAIGSGVVNGAGNGPGVGVGVGVGDGYESGSGDDTTWTSTSIIRRHQHPTQSPPQGIHPSTTPTRVEAFLLLELTKSTAIFLKAPTAKNARPREEDTEDAASVPARYPPAFPPLELTPFALLRSQSTRTTNSPSNRPLLSPKRPGVVYDEDSDTEDEDEDEDEDQFLL